MDKETTYYLYHIPGKKIGVTRDLIDRVTNQQGYALDEVEVLEQSKDIDYISDRELELQLSYGYRVDRQKYKDLYINKPKNQIMNINATEQTSTFPVPLNKLKGRLMDEIGMTWETTHGTFKISPKTIDWIMKNARTSMYTTERTYIYNKAFAKEMLIENLQEYTNMLDERVKQTNGKGMTWNKDYLKTDNRFQLIRDWAS